MDSFYRSIFKESKTLSSNLNMVQMEIHQFRFMILGGANESAENLTHSWIIECDDQQEIDYYWDALSQDGLQRQCGWLTDRYGITWQIIPKILGQLMSPPNNGKKVQAAFLKMKKMDIAALLTASKEI